MAGLVALVYVVVVVVVDCLAKGHEWDHRHHQMLWGTEQVRVKLGQSIDLSGVVDVVDVLKGWVVKSGGGAK